MTLSEDRPRVLREKEVFYNDSYRRDRRERTQRRERDSSSSSSSSSEGEVGLVFDKLASGAKRLFGSRQEKDIHYARERERRERDSPRAAGATVIEKDRIEVDKDKEEDMSYSYERTKRTTKSGVGSGFGYSGSRSTWGYWIPLALTVTAATVGVVAWVWSERRDDDDSSSSSEDERRKYTKITETTSYGGGGSGGSMQGGITMMGGGVAPSQGGFQGAPPGAMPSQGGFVEGGGMNMGGAMGSMAAGAAAGAAVGSMAAQGQAQSYYSGQGSVGGSRSIGGEEMRANSSVDQQQQQQDSTFVGSVSSVMRRTPSPAQSYNWASKKLSSAAAGAAAMAGVALGSITEGGDDSDTTEKPPRASSGQVNEEGMSLKRRGTSQEYFQEQVEMPRSISIMQKKRKTVAIVVSAVESIDQANDELDAHAVSIPVILPVSLQANPLIQSVLAHLPNHVDPTTTRIFVLIHAPSLTIHPLNPANTSTSPATSTTHRKSQSISKSSSFSNISQGDLDSHTPATTPGEFAGTSVLSAVDPKPIDEETSSLYKTLHNQAMALVDRDTQILPFTTRRGHLHILKSLGVETVYMQESLGGEDGEYVSDLSGWVRNIVVVIGDEGGAGGLIDTEDEDGAEANDAGAGARGSKWWQREERTGVGRGVSVVESLKIGEDWGRRIFYFILFYFILFYFILFYFILFYFGLKIHRNKNIDFPN